METQNNSCCTADRTETVCVLAGSIYKILVGIRANTPATQFSEVEACLDTGGGCNLSSRCPPALCSFETS
jgi:hypothetical protein